MQASQQQQMQQQGRQQRGSPRRGGRNSALDTSVLEEEDDDRGGGEGQNVEITTGAVGAVGDEFSQPVTSSRQHAARGLGGSSAFLRYAEAGDDEDEQSEEQGSIMHVQQAAPIKEESGHTGLEKPSGNARSSASAAAQPARRKRFLDEDSDED
jgi:hypothetical protein